MLTWPTLERIPLVGDLAVSPHGISTAVGLYLGLLMLQRRLADRPLGQADRAEHEALMAALGVRVAIGGIVGARAFYVLNQLDVYLDEPLRAFAIWEGGLTLLGGLVGGVLAVLPLVRRERLDLAILGDAAAPGLAVGVAIGRLGDLAIGEHLGPPSSGPLAWQCSGQLYDATTNSLRLTDRLAASPYPTDTIAAHGCFTTGVHQTALYDLVAMAILAVILLALERERRRWKGLLSVVAIGWYAAFRVVDDLLRADHRWWGLTATQWTALVVLATLVVYLYRRRPWRRTTSGTASPPLDPSDLDADGRST